MATSAIIKVEGLKGVVLYKHHDGHPNSTLPWLEKFNREFSNKRKYDPEYKFAQLVRSSIYMVGEFNLNESTVTGWGVCVEPTHGDYSYTLLENGEVKIER